MSLCPACEKGQSHPCVSDEALLFNGRQVVANGIEFSRCEYCGEEWVNAEQSARNEPRFDAARAASEGPIC